tara:strand:- start:390 stop:833 length:444 start_codon:yes stop_codon:yes gene_type:complete
MAPPYTMRKAIANGGGCSYKGGQKGELQLAGNVFVTQENPRVDILPATQWGDLTSLATPFDQILTNPGRLVAQIKRKLERFDDEDWLLAMGDPAIIGIAFAIAADANAGRVNMLKWDKMERQYYPVRIRLRGGGIEELNNLTREYVD